MLLLKALPFRTLAEFSLNPRYILDASAIRILPLYGNPE